MSSKNEPQPIFLVQQQTPSQVYEKLRIHFENIQNLQPKRSQQSRGHSNNKSLFKTTHLAENANSGRVSFLKNFYFCYCFKSI